VIEPPEWAGQEGKVAPRDFELDPGAQMDALEQMKLDADDVPELPPWAPPLTHQPLSAVRPGVPPVDWQEEERQRLERERREQARRKRHEALLRMLEEETS
jgi:hypothetical protein